jgi:hypothetical protein
VTPKGTHGRVDNSVRDRQVSATTPPGHPPFAQPMMRTTSANARSLSVFPPIVMLILPR